MRKKERKYDFQTTKHKRQYSGLPREPKPKAPYCLSYLCLPV